MDSNVPVVDLAGALAPDKLTAWLDYQFADHVSNVATLTARYEKFCEVTASGIGDDVMAGHSTDFVKLLKDEINATDTTRTRIKAPVLHAQRLIDGEAKKLTDQLNTEAGVVTDRITDFLRRKEAEARRAAEAEAERLRIEAEARIAEAQATATIEANLSALEAIDQAETAAAIAEAKPIELTRTRSAGGGLTGLKDNWVYDVVDLAKVPAHLLTVNDAAVKLAIKQGSREIPGIRIWNNAKAFVR
jgi:hypothetical protein